MKTDTSGNLYIVGKTVIQQVSPNGTIETVAAIKPTLYSTMMAVDPSGNTFFVFDDSRAIWKIDRTGKSTKVAGGGNDEPADGMLATLAAFPSPHIAADSSGNLFIFAGYYVWRLDSAGILHQFAGNGGDNSFVENGIATQQGITLSFGAIAVDMEGNVFFANGQTIAEVDTSGRMHTVSGSQAGPSLESFGGPVSLLSLDGRGNLYFSRSGDNVTAPAIQKLTPTGTLSFLAKIQPYALTSDPNGNLYYTTGDPYINKLSPASATPVPVINQAGVVGAGGSVPAVPAVSPNALASLYGSNFIAAGTHRNVLGSDLVNGKLPTNLGGVCVNFGTTPAPYILAKSMSKFPRCLRVQSRFG